MKSFTSHRLWSLLLGVPLAACGGGTPADLFDAASREPDLGGNAGGVVGANAESAGTAKASPIPLSFPGAGTSGAAKPLVASLPPESRDACDPERASAESATDADVQVVCFYGPEEPQVPAAVIEQVVEVVGNAEWVHLRLTLNPNFVDNTYGDNAIGWSTRGADDAPEPPAPLEAPDAGAPPPVPPLPEATDGGVAAGPRGRPGPGAPPDRERPEPPAPGERPGLGGRGHTFRDLLRSDHAEIQLLDAAGDVAMHFRIDYVSESADAPSGFASLGVSGGDGDLSIGEPEWVLATTTSIDRNLNACGLASFTESSPATDDAYTPAPDASDWDYRVAYEIWVATEAFGAAGFGSALIENVHASPSKLADDTVDVVPAPCPIDPEDPEAVPVPVPVVLEQIR